jgi:hypothetical protein
MCRAGVPVASRELRNCETNLGMDIIVTLRKKVKLIAHTYRSFSIGK